MLTSPAGLTLPAASGPFDLVAGLPLHPLVVHVAVVLLPLSAVALVLVVLIPRARKPFGWITMVGLAIGAAGAFVAKESGEALAERVGTPTEHADLGASLPLLALLLLLIALGWFFLQRRSAGTRSVATTISGIAAIVMAVVVTVMTVLVGHSGATAVWSGTVTVSTTETSAAAESGSAAATTQAYTLADVAGHADESSCWAAIDGSVYDLTEWVGQHPGGADRILSICGTDATAAFATQHDGQQEPAAELATFQIGTLAG